MTDSIEFQATDEANDKPKVDAKENIAIEEAQPKTETEIEQAARIEEVLDIIRTGGESCDVICRVKCNCVAMDSWVPYEQLKQTNPQKLIKYFETRIDWPHKQQ